MYTVVRYYVKSAIVFLFLGILLGAYMSYEINVRKVDIPHSIVTAHTHLILVGFVMMLIMGIALWLFPRPREKVFYSPYLSEVTFYVMFFSILFRGIGETLDGFITIPLIRWDVLIASWMEVIGIILFFINVWQRIKPIGSHFREEKGEKF